MNKEQFGLKQAAKAWLAGPAAGFFYLTGLGLAMDTQPAETFVQMTTGEWAGLGLAVLVGYGVTWVTPNRSESG